MWKTAIACACAAAGTALLAQAPAAPATERSGPRGDPNEIVCINQAEIGSRLARRRVCRTRAQWDELAEQTRRVIERVQFEKQTGNQ